MAQEKRKSKKQLAIEKNVEEFLKCKNDFYYFCSNYILLELPGGDRELIPYDKQAELIDLIHSEHFVLVLKSRQVGISTVTQAYCAWLAVFYDNTVIGIVSKDGAEATTFARTIAGMIEKLPAWMRPKGGQSGQGFAKRSEQSFILTNGSKCYAATVNPKAPSKTLRGRAVTFLVIDEAAFVEKIEDAWTGMVPALSTNQKHAREAGVPYGTVVLSTPNKTQGVGAWFYKRYTNALAGDDIFKSFIIHWKDIKELAEDPDWYATQCALFDNDKKKIQQELELKFVSSKGSFFDENIIEKLQDQTKDLEPIDKIKLYNGEVWKFANPEEGKSYLIGVDTAPSHGDDKSALTVWDIETLEEVWEYQGKCEVQDYIKVVRLAASIYIGALIIELNSYGNQVVEAVKNDSMETYLYKEANKNIPGLTTTAKTRPLMIDALYSYVNEFPEIVKSRRLAMELVGLTTKTSGRVEADSGCYDDLAMSAAMAFYVRKYDMPLMLNTSSLNKSSFKTIMAMNDINVNEINNDTILDIVKETMDKNINQESYFNILNMYTKE